MNADRLTLTAYFGERDRTRGRRLVADELLDVFGAHGVRASHPAARRRGLRPPARPAHRPPAQRLRGPAGGRDRGRRGASGSRPAGARCCAIDAPRPGHARAHAHARPSPASPPSSRPEPAEAAKLTVVSRPPRARRRARRRTSPSASCCTRGGIDGATVLLGVDGTRRGHPRARRVLRRATPAFR